MDLEHAAGVREERQAARLQACVRLVVEFRTELQGVMVEEDECMPLVPAAEFQSRCPRQFEANVPRNSPVLVEYLKRQIGAAEEDMAPPPADPEKPAVTLATVAQGAKGKSSGIAALPPDAKMSVRVIFVLAFLNMTLMTTITPTLLLYLHYIGFTSDYDIHFYVTVSVIGTAVPVFTHVLLAKASDLFGAGRTLSLACVTVALGLAGMSTFTNSKVVFACGYLAYSVSQSLRPVRTIVLSDVTPDASRTEVMSVHALMTPIGALFGPAIWLLVERYPGEQSVLGVLRLNRFTLAYIFAAAIALAMSAIVAAFLPKRTAPQEDAGVASTNGETRTSSPEEEVLNVHMDDGRDIEVHPARFRRHIFMYFCVIMFACNMSMGLYMVSFQPIMVMKGATGQDLGLIYEIISLTAVVPPLLVAYLSKRLLDREILLIGLCSKIIGICLFLPIFGKPVRGWAVVTGYVLLIKASIFFFTAAMSLFTKLLGGGLMDGVLIGFLSSFSALGPAIAQLFFADKMLTLFGGFEFGIFMLPVLCALGLVVWPWYWVRLDSEREFNRHVREEYAALHSKRDK